MKFEYSRDVDTLLMELGNGKFDYVEENDGVIVHYGKNAVPVLLEIMDAGEFLINSVTKALDN